MTWSEFVHDVEAAGVKSSDEIDELDVLAMAVRH